MKLIRCNNGHFYDQDRFGTCPHCSNVEPATGNTAVENVPEAPQSQNTALEDVGVTVALQPASTPVAEPVSAPVATSIPSKEELNRISDSISNVPEEKPEPMVNTRSTAFTPSQTEDYTVAMIPGGKAMATKGVKPVVGWLICLSGEHVGKDFRLVQGKNFIGRAADMDICLEGEKTVSREKHAVVVYEPKQHMFLIQSGESRELTYVNDKVILEATELKASDEILVGDVKLLFVPLCSTEFDWAKVLEKEDSVN